METHILLFIFAGLLIAVLIGHSLWSARREKSRIFSNTFSTRPPSSPIQTESTLNVPPTLNTQKAASDYPLDHTTPPLNNDVQQEIENSVKDIKIRLAGDPEPAVAEPIVSVQSPIQQPVVEPEPYVEPTTPTVNIQPEVEEHPATTEENQPTNMITLYVVAAEGQQFRGDTVVQNLETLGFEFGEYQIFHRHLNDSSSPVLFSVANMMQPGIFDLHSIEQFQTVGLVFFMHLPSAGNDLVNLRLMIRTVESFAQSMGGFVLNDQQQLFDDQARQAYLLRVSQQ